MALNIRNPEAEKLAEAVAVLTGETKTEAVTRALRERLGRLKRERARRGLADEPERRAFTEAIEAAASCSVSVAAVLETSMVVRSRFGSDG